MHPALQQAQASANQISLAMFQLYDSLRNHGFVNDFLLAESRYTFKQAMDLFKKALENPSQSC